MSLPDHALQPGIFVDLDALFDTRLALLHHIDPLLAARALRDGYLSRVDNNFPHCPLELFEKAYAQRDNDILAASMMTPVKNIILDFAKEAAKTLGSRTTKIYPHIYVNVYPYKISKDNSDEVLKPFYDSLDGKVNVHLVNVAPDQLKPQDVKKNLSYIIKYDYLEWLLKMGPTIIETPMHGVTLVGPDLFPSGKPQDELLWNDSRSEMSPQQCAEVYFSPFIKLELYPTRLFCAAIDQFFVDEYINAITDKYKKD
jgi:hypothetical protein